jgi:hypothetical protein
MHPMTPEHEGEFVQRAEGEVISVEFADGTYITRAPSGDYRACNDEGAVLYSGPFEGAWNWLDLARTMDAPVITPASGSGKTSLAAVIAAQESHR